MEMVEQDAIPSKKKKKKNIKKCSYLLPGNSTLCFYSQEDLFLLIGTTLAGKDKGENSSLHIQKVIGQFNLFLC